MADFSVSLLLGRGISPSQGRYLHTEYKQNKLTDTSMPRVGFKSTIPAFERANTVYTSDRAATAMGNLSTTYILNRFEIGIPIIMTIITLSMVHILSPTTQRVS
jgi:hypothetical protein